MSINPIERAAQEFGVDVETYRTAVNTSLVTWSELTGDNRPLRELPTDQALGRVGCVMGLVLPSVIDEMTGRTADVEPEPFFDMPRSKVDNPTERRLAEYAHKANEYAAANPNSQQNPFDDVVRQFRAGTLSFEN